MTEATSRGMFSGCGVGLKSSISGLESIIPVSTSTSPAGWSIVQTNTGQRSPSTRSSAARCGRAQMQRQEDERRTDGQHELAEFGCAGNSAELEQRVKDAERE